MSFGHALKAVLPHVSAPKYNLPTLESVQVRYGTVMATDRYTMAYSTFDTTGVAPFEPFLLPAKTAKTLAKPDVNLAGWDADTETLVLTNGTTLHVPQRHSGDYPNVDRIMETCRNYDERVPVSGNVFRVKPEYLARLSTRALVRDKSEQNLGVRFVFGPSMDKMIYWTFGDHTEGALMPIRLE